MNTSIKPLVGLALAALAFGATAAPPLASDEVVASFERMLNHESTPTAPINLAELQRKGPDPLAKAVNVALWEQDPPQYHIAPQASADQPIRR